MKRRALLLLVAAALGSGCLRYEYEHEFWLKVDGSGRVYVTGSPALWNAFKGVGRGDDLERTVTPEALRELFSRAGLRVRKVTLTRREGRPYLFVAADFDDISRLTGSVAFPDLDVHLSPEGERLRLDGTWHRPERAAPLPPLGVPGLLAVRFHLPSKVYEHRNAAGGVERGNIVGWREDVAAAEAGTPLPFGALMDRRSILWSTIGLFAIAIGSALAVLAAVLYGLLRRGRRTAA